MKTTNRTSRTAVFMVLITLLCARAHALPKVRILATGGTIAGIQRSADSAGYDAAVLTVDDLLKQVPQAGKLADLSGEQICDVPSQNMNDEVWLKLARRLNEVLQDAGVDGVVITHGTDTMEETAYFLSLVAKSEKAIVMVGSMRPSNALGADGPINLYNAIALAANPQTRSRGVLVVMNDEIHYAREIEKRNTTQLNALSSPNRGLAGVIQNGHAVFFSPLNLKYGVRSEFSLDKVKQLPRVEVVYSYAGFGRETIDFLVSKGVKGIVLAGVGDGNTTDQALAGLRDAAKRGVLVVRSTRAGSGVTSRNMEVNDDELGFVAGQELNPAKARVLLMLALTETNDIRAIQEYFLEY